MAHWQPQPKIITQKIPNQHIFLYQGFAELINDDKIIEGKVFIKISWHPSPNINFKFTYFGEDRIGTENQDKLELKLTELVPQHRLRVYISSSTYWGNKKNQLTGHLIEPFFKGTTNNLASVVFHLPNFWWFNISNHFDDEEDEEGNLVEIEREGWLMFDGQFIFDYDNWHIVLSTLDNCYELQELLESEGGYGVTHICKIERLDKTTFTLEEAYQIIEAFSYYLSFVRGIWIAPLLVSGFDSEGNQLLEEWRNPIIKGDSWQHGNRWSYLDSTTEIVAPFAGFMKKWQDPTWKEVIQNAIQWYIESLKHFNGYNTSIILLQAALEKIAWTFLKVNEYVTSDGFNGLKASGQIRLLLKSLDVGLEPIEKYIEIQKKAKELNWNDSVLAITEARNSIVHPQIKSNKSEFPSEKIRREVFQISNIYLLKCLLKLFEYGYSID
ncbi:hypothetical protein PQG02_31980 (plasmid) [Nostoc sp. UHCC 0926]|uniref:hypothetical protein n=1 Tax=Nostoc sp. UHCC 0926 TaxID=3025190 RepID=UPI0023600D3B|nr:hypothetical protein [Nostoc sp. UHCC 0926]WDD36022.1 hypothetical protein PQG02_31980 [Nostoc sp. UHCC 0926]